MTCINLNIQNKKSKLILIFYLMIITMCNQFEMIFKNHSLLYYVVRFFKELGLSADYLLKNDEKI